MLEAYAMIGIAAFAFLAGLSVGHQSKESSVIEERRICIVNQIDGKKVPKCFAVVEEGK